ncbi:MAG TPA: cupredoxin domain-containing protein [Stellaceae bacterium]|nr:cupredoxin domain-containing protein [Stellaceae bacterium]
MYRLLLALTILTAIIAAPAMAEDSGVTITIKDHRFVPDMVEIPAGTKVKIVVRNEDTTTSEFESVAFHREKVVQPGSEITLFVGPLDPGSYEFFDDFHPETRGHLVAK